MISNKTLSQELEMLLGLHSTMDGSHIKISCTTEFEPHGRASETWEVVWFLELLNVPWRWKSTKEGWIEPEGVVGHPCMNFKGRTLDDVLTKAINFLKEIK